MSNEPTDINGETRARVIAAADQLYEASGRETFPTVDAVRRASKVDMNAASTVMREWRRMRTVAPAAVTVAVPDRLRQAYEGALSALWAEAQEISNEALKAAQAAWDGERAEAEALRAEMAQAFESQGAELENATARGEELQRQATSAGERAEQLQQQLAAESEARRVAESRAVVAEQRAAEIQQRADDLRAELQQAHEDAKILRAERDSATAKVEVAQQIANSANAQLDTMRDELATARAQVRASGKFQQERDAAVQVAAQAREEAARLSGQLQAAAAQVDQLTRMLGERTAAKPVTAKNAKAPAKKAATRAPGTQAKKPAAKPAK